MEEFSKEGRKLRPRKSAAGSGSHSERVDFNSNYGEHRPQGEGRPYGDRPRQYGEHRPQGEHRPYGDRPRQYGEHRPYGEGGEHRQHSDHRPYGDRPRQYGEHRPQGEGRPYGDRPRQYGEHRPQGEHRPYGEGGERPQRSSFSGNGEHRQHSDHRPQGEGRPYGDRPRQYGEHKPGFGPRKPGFAGKPHGDRPGFGPRKPFGRGPQPTFNKDSNEGINRMISRRPVVNGSEYDENEAFDAPIRDEVRLNKFIANSGVCSRREADTLIQAGVVTVNGEVVTELGVKINIHDDDVRFNGERLKGEEKVYIVMNKPKGFVTTASDPHADKTVLDLVKNCSARVYPVGRLDKNTTGVLMLTNDGEIAERLTHPSYDKKKIYQVILDRALEQADYDQILAGVTLTDGEVNADELEYIDENDKRKLGIEIHSGKNRIVRRIFETLGYNVRALDRVYFAGLTKKGLKKGEWRYLTEGEINILKMGAYV